MGFEIGQVYKYYDIAASLGYNEGTSSMTGGLFYRDGVLVMIKDESGKDYDDRWDPYRPGVLTFYATLKTLGRNKGPLMDLPMTTKANYHFEKGDCKILLFTKNGTNYTYLGEFERIPSEPTYMVKNNYRVPAYDVVSKDPDKIKDLIDVYVENYSLTDWSEKDRLALTELYNPLCTTADDLHELALALHKTTSQIEVAISDIGSKEIKIVEQGDLRIVLRNIRNTIDEALGDDPSNSIQSTRQSFRENIFRYNVGNIFDHKCCLTGISEKNVLQACHVEKADPASNQSFDPNCGILLNRFHSSLFADHLMTITTDGDVLYSDSLRESMGGCFDSMCLKYRHIDWPDHYTPVKNAFRHHNESFEERSELLKDAGCC